MSTMPELDSDDRRQLDDVVDFVTALLGDAVTAAYLYGSAVCDGLRADSDLDILVVLGRPTTGPEREVLIHGLMARSRSPEHRERRPLEVSAVVLSDVRPWRYPPPLELQYGDWWRSAYVAGDLSPWATPDPDLAVLLTTARADGVALVGPPADEVLDPVPPEDLQRAVRAVIPVLLPGLEEDDTRNSLLTLARIWLTLATGRIESKQVAAAWALERLPAGTGAGLRLARAGYLGEARDTWDEPTMADARNDWRAMLDAIDRP